MQYNDEEIWLDVVGMEGLYEISSHGNVRRCGSTKNRKPRLTSSGYYRIGLSEDGIQTDHYVHILVAEAFLPAPLPEHTEVNHINGNRTDNRVENLEWCSRKENIEHAQQNGVPKFKYTRSEEAGAKNKLTEDDVRAIRAKFKPGLTSALAREFRVSWSTINQIVQRKIWRSVE